MSRKVGVEFRDRIWVVEFTVGDGVGFDAIEVINVEEFFADSPGYNSGGTRVKISHARYNELLGTPEFHFAVLYAVADFDGQDFDPQTFKRRN